MIESHIFIGSSRAKRRGLARCVISDTRLYWRRPRTATRQAWRKPPDLFTLSAARSLILASPLIVLSRSIRMAVQSTLRSSLDSAKIATMSRLMSYASFYSRNYTGIQHVLRVIYLLGVAFGMLSMFAPRSSRKKKSPKQKSSAAMTDSGDPPNKKEALDAGGYA